MKHSISSGPDPIYWWGKLERWELGRWLFSKVIGFVVPYTGTIKPSVIRIENGFAKIDMKNARRVRNHMGTVHAIAMSNLVELAASLALMSREEDFDFIVTEISTKYLAPAVGPHVTAFCNTDDLTLQENMTGEVILYSGNSRVATGTCKWRVKHGL